MTTKQIQKKIEKHRSEIRSLEIMLMLKQPHLTSVEDLHFMSVRAYTVLRMANIQTLEDLLNWSEKQLLKLRYCGHKTIRELKAGLAEYGLALK